MATAYYGEEPKSTSAMDFTEKLRINLLFPDGVIDFNVCLYSLRGGRRRFNSFRGVLPLFFKSRAVADLRRLMDELIGDLRLTSFAT